jgi:hypothetical protein
MSSKNKTQKKLDKTSLGLLIGFCTPFIGFLIVSVGYAKTLHASVSDFIFTSFINTHHYQSPIISLSLLINLIPFFAFYRSKKDYSARGVILGTMIYIPIIFYLKYIRYWF